MNNKFIIETSARHIHLSKKDLETLFGEGYKLTNKKDLSQPGQFACNERVTVVGPKGEIKNITILGPERNNTQIEISATDARILGVDAIIRESGDIDGSCGCKLVGPAGEVVLDKGLIVAKRHIHMTKQDADNLCVKNKDIVWVKVESNDRSTIFGDVVVRVSDDFALSMHIDTDEANACQAKGEVFGEIIKL